MQYSPLLEQLIRQLQILPGVGPKSAQRMAFHLLERNRDGARRLGESLSAAATRMGHCQHCQMLTEEPVCSLCSDATRDRTLLCVVGSPADVVALEHATGFRGVYFVLGGYLSPLDGIGPEALKLDRLEARLAAGDIREVILATGSTVEGEATSHYVAELAAKYAVTPSRIAQGVPLGGDLDNIDGGTLSHAFAGRRVVPMG